MFKIYTIEFDSDLIQTEKVMLTMLSSTYTAQVGTGIRMQKAKHVVFVFIERHRPVGGEVEPVGAKEAKEEGEEESHNLLPPSK